MPAKKLKLPRAKIIFVSPFVIDTAQPTKRQIPAQLPCVLLPCATVKQARQVTAFFNSVNSSYPNSNRVLTKAEYAALRTLNLPTP